VRGVDPKRHAGEHADQDREGRELQGRGKDARDVLRDRPSARARLAEIALRHALDVAAELHPDRPVETELLARLEVGLLRGLVADRRDDRIDRHHAADHEGDEEEARQGDEKRREAGGRAHRT
jgi:hypothetical protein